MKVYKAIFHRLVAIDNCEKSNNPDWKQIHEEALYKIIRDYLPRGSGIDEGVTVDLSENRKFFILRFSILRMDDHGFYAEWLDYRLSIHPDLLFNFEIKAQGSNKQGIKDYLVDTFQHALNQEVK